MEIEDLMKALDLDDNFQEQIEIEEFLASIFHKTSGFIEVRYNNFKSSKFYPIDEKGITELAKTFLKKEDVFFGVLPRTKEQKNEEAIEQGQVLFCDFDPIKTPTTKKVETKLDTDGSLLTPYKNYLLKRPSITEFLTKFELKPSYVVSSGAGYHCYWILKSPLPKDKWRKLQEMLINKLQEVKIEGLSLDAQVKDAPRILRLPNTINTKYNLKTKIMYTSNATYAAENIAHYAKKPDPENTIKYDPTDIENAPENYKIFIEKAVKVLSPHWKEGQRDYVTLYFAGYCRKASVPITVVKSIIETIQKTFGDDEKDLKNRQKVIENTYSDMKNNLKGASGLKELGIDLTELDSILQPTKEERKSVKINKEIIFYEFLEMYESVLYRDDLAQGSMLYIWNGETFEALTFDKFKKLIMNFVQSTYGRIISNDIANIIYDNLLAANEVKKRPPQKKYITFKNRAFNLVTERFEEPSPENGNLFTVNANVIPELFYEASKIDSWLDSYWYVINKTQHLKRYFTNLEMDSKRFQQLIEIGGYMMLPRIPEYNFEVAFFLTGKGMNGKSLYLSVLDKLFSPYTTSLGIDRFDGFSMSMLLGKYFNICDEINDKHEKVISAENFKKVISWNPMEIPIKFREHLRASIKIINVWSMNSLPVFNDYSEGTLRRIIEVNFHRRIPDHLVDRQLATLLETELDYIATLFLVAAAKIVATKNLTLYNDVQTKKRVAAYSNAIVDWLRNNYEPLELVDPGMADEFIHSANQLRNDFNEWYNVKNYFRNSAKFIEAVEQALQILALDDKEWEIVKYFTDTKNSYIEKEIGVKKRYTNVFVNLYAKN